MLLRLEPGKITVRTLIRVVRADLSLLRKALVRWVPLTDLHVDVSEGAMFPPGRGMSECSECQSLGNDSHLLNFQKEVACVSRMKKETLLISQIITC